MRYERETAARLGVRTHRGDFERALVADVIRALRVVGIHEMRAGNMLALTTVEDRERFVECALADEVAAASRKEG